MTITTRREKLYSWIKRIFYWFVDTHEFWITVAVLFCSLLFVLIKGTDKRVPLITGLCLQLLGILTVAWGIRKTRILFGLPRLSDSISKSIKSFPPYHEKIIYLEAKGVSSCTLTARAHLSCFASEEAPIEERVAALEKNIKNIHTHITEIKSEMDDKTRTQSEELSRERQERTKNYKELNTILEATETGGLNISAMGALWLFIGVILSTIPDMISTFLK